MVVTAQVTGNCATSAAKTIRVGIPASPTYIDDDEGVGCPEWWFYTNLVNDVTYVWQTFKLPSGTPQVATNGGTSQRFVYAQNGTWRTGIYFQNACGNSPTIFRDVVVTCNTEGQFMTVYPNPSSDYLVISTLSPLEEKDVNLYQIQIVDEAGGVFLQMESSEQLTRIDVSNYPPGRYFLRIQSASGIDERQIIIE